MNVEAIIFDLDGTLWNSTKQIAESWNGALKTEYPELSLRVNSASVSGVAGMTMNKIAETLFPEMTNEKRTEAMNILMHYEVEHLKVHPGIAFPDVCETLRQLKNKYRLFIASNCQKGYIDTFINGYDLGDVIEGQICFEDTGLDKGHNLKILMEREGITSAVMIGDTMMDKTAADYAQIPFIHAAYGFGKVQEACKSIKTITELLTI